MKRLTSISWNVSVPRHFPRNLLLLTPRKTWKKRFDSILFNNFDSVKHGKTRMNFSSPNSVVSNSEITHSTCSAFESRLYVWCESQNLFITAAVLLERLHQSEVRFVEVRVIWKRYWAAKYSRNARHLYCLLQFFRIVITLASLNSFSIVPVLEISLKKKRQSIF
jgi:hypothetical protein